jgi:hypothetical protein
MKPMKDKVAFLKVPSVNLVAMIAAQSLLVLCGMDSSPESIFLKERGIIWL